MKHGQKGNGSNHRSLFCCSVKGKGSSSEWLDFVLSLLRPRFKSGGNTDGTRIDR